MRKILLGAVLLSLAPALAHALSVSVQEVALRFPEGGPFPKAVPLTVTSAGPWRATVSNPDMLTLDPMAGTGDATIRVVPVASWVSSRPAGSYESTIAITDEQNVPRTVQVTYTVLARHYPRVSYIAGPTGCSDVPGLPPSNAAVCTVPGERPAGDFAPPLVGKSYVDPNFGAVVRILGRAPSVHGYSTPSPISAGNHYALISEWGIPMIVDLLSGRLKARVPFGVEGALWDAQDKSLLYFFSGASVQRYNVSTGSAEVLVDYSRGPFRFSSISAGGAGEISRDNWLSFVAPRERRVCALDVGAKTTYCGDMPAGVDVDYVTISKGVDRASGMRYVVLVPGDGAFAVYAVNAQSERLDLVARGPENVVGGEGNLDGICDPGEACLNGSHSDIMEDSAGNQLLVLAIDEQTPCGVSIYTIQLNKDRRMGLPVELGGGLKRVFPLFRCGAEDTWVDLHIGCAKAAPYCVVSTTSEPYKQPRDPNDKTPLKRTAHLGEIMVIRDNGAEVRRLAQHRSLAFSSDGAGGYWSTPRAAISADGAYVVADSNYGTATARQRVVVIETGFAKPRD